MHKQGRPTEIASSRKQEIKQWIYAKIMQPTSKIQQRTTRRLVQIFEIFFHDLIEDAHQNYEPYNVSQAILYKQKL